MISLKGLIWAISSAVALAALPIRAAPLGGDVRAFMDNYCFSCHNDVDREAGLDLTELEYAPSDPENLARWTTIHDRVNDGEMPPKKKKRPPAGDTVAFMKSLAGALTSSDEALVAQTGRTTRRRLNRTEYEYAVRDLFQAPWLLVKEHLPEDGEAAHFNKVSRALDVSYVHMARYMSAADYAIRQVITAKFQQPKTRTTRYWARDNFGFYDHEGNPDRGRFPVLGSGPDVDTLSRKRPLTAGNFDPARRELEAMAWTSSHFQTGFNTNWLMYRTPVTGKYNLRFSGNTIWVGPNGSIKAHAPSAGLAPSGANAAAATQPPSEWHRANPFDITVGQRNEPVHIYAKVGTTAAARIMQFDLTPVPAVYEANNVWLVANQTIITDAVRFFRPRSGLNGDADNSNKLAQRDGMPGVAFRWMEVEGPLYDESTTAGYRLLFGDLPLRRVTEKNQGVEIEILPDPLRSPPTVRGEPLGSGRIHAVREDLELLAAHDAQARSSFPIRAGFLPVPVRLEVVSAAPLEDAERLLRSFLPRAYRRPVPESEVNRFLALFHRRLQTGAGFADALLTTYTAVLASQEFVYLDEGKSGPLDDHALATRLALLLWNSAPDAALRERADRGELRRSEILKSETERLLADPRSGRFIEAFLNYWLDVRKMFDTTSDAVLYNDYYLDDALLEASVDETRLFFAELLRKNMPARNIVDSDFTFLNDRLAAHYGVEGIGGVAMRRVALPAGSVRGGMMTQAIVLKVTANGTTTSPILRGKWIMERIAGQEIPPPPAAVPAVEPDIRGAVTIRQQLVKHRADQSCARCHQKIDPPGFALESFDVMGAWRDRYRAMAGKGETLERGIGHNGLPLAFHYALPVDPSGQMPDGREFKDIRDFKRLLLQDEAQIARNFVRHLSVYATGAPVRFGDRRTIEQILEKTASSQYGIRAILHEIIQSDLFRNK